MCPVVGKLNTLKSEPKKKSADCSVCRKRKAFLWSKESCVTFYEQLACLEKFKI